MEAVTNHSKKSINKGKMKKSIKNVLCRPDPVFWPLVSNEHKNAIEIALRQHKVEIPSFEKPHWKELKLIPKEKRPKPPKIQKVEGLLFGLSTCSNAIKSKQCAAVIVESTINPRTIVQPIIEECVNSRVPVLCVENLRIICADNFGIPTSCLGIKCDFLKELTFQILDVAKKYNLPQAKTEVKESECIETMEVVKEETFEQINITKPSTQSPYLFRNDKKSRVFVPSEGKMLKGIRDFSGQDFIEFSENQAAQNAGSKPYMKMVLKRISNNPNRVRVK